MRFYYLPITLLLLTLNLSAQPADAVELSTKQLALIQSQGASGIKTVLRESKIDLQDAAAVHAFVSQIVFNQISEISAPASITEITSPLTIEIAKIALADYGSDKINFVIETISAGAADGVIKASENSNIDVREAIKYASSGSTSGAIHFALGNELDTAKATSAAASGATAGAIKIALGMSYDVLEITKFASSGSLTSAIYESLDANINVGEHIKASAYGSAEASVEAPVIERFKFMKIVQSNAAALSAAAIKASQEENLNIDKNIAYATAGATFGVKQAANGLGANTRITINPIPMDPDELNLYIVNSFSKEEAQIRRLPIIETSYEDDPDSRQVSPASP